MVLEHPGPKLHPILPHVPHPHYELRIDSEKGQSLATTHTDARKLLGTLQRNWYLCHIRQAEEWERQDTVSGTDTLLG